MNETTGSNWATRYSALAAGLPSQARDHELFHSGIFLCGMSACVDARVDMHNMEPLLDVVGDLKAASLRDLLVQRAEHGIGGEIRFDWLDGPAWLRENLNPSFALGGTGPQAAWVLSKLGARGLIALEDRHEQMLRQLPHGILLAKDAEVVAPVDIVPSSQQVPEIFIFEYTAGRTIGRIIPKRSSRVIVRFSDRGIQDDRDFMGVSLRLAPTAAAGLLSGLNDEPLGNIGYASKRVFDVARTWRVAGLKTVHLELAGYASDALREVLSFARGAITSIGMSHSELLAMEPTAGHPMEALVALGERLCLERVCVHADTWAASVTVGDPHHELRAIMAGCAIASARASAGEPVERVTIDPRARFEDLPFEGYAREGKWSFVACAAPYIPDPKTTLGLGDSFTAGCLLVLGRRSTRVDNHSV